MSVTKGSRYGADDMYLDQLLSGHTVLSVRRPLLIPESSEDETYVTRTGETYWTVSGLREIYGDPRYYFLIADANPSPLFFSGMFKALPPNTPLRIPPIETALEVLNGRFTTRRVLAR